MAQANIRDSDSDHVSAFDCDVIHEAFKKSVLEENIPADQWRNHAASLIRSPPASTRGQSFPLTRRSPLARLIDKLLELPVAGSFLFLGLFIRQYRFPLPAQANHLYSLWARIASSVSGRRDSNPQRQTGKNAVIPFNYVRVVRRGRETGPFRVRMGSPHPVLSSQVERS